MTQRIGRTGRKRSGRVVTLVTRDEKKKQSRAKSSRKRLDKQLAAAAGQGNSLRSSKAFQLSFNKCNPRMLPEDIYPVCEGRDITVGSFRSSQVAGIGLSQSDPRRAKELLKSKYDFDPKVSDSQRSFLRREFGFQGSGSGGG